MPRIKANVAVLGQKLSMLKGREGFLSQTECRRHLRISGFDAWIRMVESCWKLDFHPFLVLR